jgi:hypothetical protein
MGSSTTNGMSAKAGASLMARRARLPWLLLCPIIAALATVSCGGSDSGGSAAAAANSAAPTPATATPPSGTSGAAGAAAGTLIISGVPPTVVKAGQAYDFRPQVANTGSAALVFSIANKPAWANFDSTTGELWGTPASGLSGIYGGVRISVSNGKASLALPSFPIFVLATGAMVVTWQAPLTNTDGTYLGDLSGYKLYYKKSDWSKPRVVEIADPAEQSFTLVGLAKGLYKVSMTAVNAARVESNPTPEFLQIVL